MRANFQGGLPILVSAIEFDFMVGFALDNQVIRFMESLTKTLLTNLRYLALDLDQLRHT